MSYKQIAIIAPTASGKTDLSIQLALKINAVILSLDSLCVYNDINIASAKPTIKQRKGIKHFGIDIINPNEHFNVALFVKEYKKAKNYALNNKKNLIIVGGTGFYLKSLIQGLSTIPNITKDIQNKTKPYILDLQKGYELLYKIDKQYMKKIKPTDRYRIQKTLELYFASSLTPTEYFKNNKPKPIINDIDIYQIDTKLDDLRDKISKRTNKMIKDGLVDEVIMLEQKYKREPKCMKAIGIKETFDYIDGKFSIKQLEQLISTHTAQLAKRQRTFNRSQFKCVKTDNIQNIENLILSSQIMSK